MVNSLAISYTTSTTLRVVKGKFKTQQVGWPGILSFVAFSKEIKIPGKLEQNNQECKTH